MALVNEHYLTLKAGYLFPEIGRRVQAFQKAHSKARIIRLGIGDVVLPLAPSIVKAFRVAVDEMGDAKTFRGYGPEQGYPFLLEAIIAHEYRPRQVSLKTSEVFVSDGSKCDTGNIQELFAVGNRIAVTDPVYPVYVDTNIMAGRGGNILYLPTTPGNNFSPNLPKERVDVIYLCSPNNPTGAVLSRVALQQWVAYARKNHSIILFDAAYEAFITDDSLPHSIFEIDGAREVAIEFRSFSKKAGFTGTRCAFTVVPHELKGYDAKGSEILFNPLWNRRQTTKFNGVSYPVQRAAAACYTVEGKSEIQGQIDYTLTNARLIREGLQKAGFKVHGGENAPYLWAKTTQGLDSWATFDKMLAEAHVVVTPGSGFGPSGEGFFRLSAFGIREEITEAVQRIQKIT